MRILILLQNVESNEYITTFKTAVVEAYLN